MTTKQTAPMLAYHGDPAFRRRFLAEIKKYEKADAIMRGTYGEKDSDGKWRGCAIGCSLRSLNRMAGKRSDVGTAMHNRYPKELGIPVQLAYLEDKLFEGMPADDAKAWPMRFSSAIRTGADLSLVWPHFAHWLLVDAKDGVIRFARTDAQRAAINGVARLFERQIAALTPDLAQYERVKKVALLENEFTIEGGEMTPTLKVKRRVIDEKYRQVIDEIYRDE